MCLLPPNCLFCLNYFHEPDVSGWDCRAYEEIPDTIFAGGRLHEKPYPGDHGFQFQLNPELVEEYEDVQDLKRQIQRA